MDLVHAANADGEQELLLRLDIEASLGLSLALQADGLLLLSNRGSLNQTHVPCSRPRMLCPMCATPVKVHLRAILLDILLSPLEDGRARGAGLLLGLNGRGGLLSSPLLVPLPLLCEQLCKSRRTQPHTTDCGYTSRRLTHQGRLAF